MIQRITIIIEAAYRAEARRKLGQGNFKAPLNASGDAAAAVTHYWTRHKVRTEGDIKAIRQLFDVPWAVVSADEPDTILKVAGLKRPEVIFDKEVVPPSPPGTTVDLETLSLLQHRAAWMPPAVNPPYDYADFADADALRRAGVIVPADDVARRVEHYGNPGQGRGWVLIETWVSPDGTTWQRRIARRFDGPDATRSHDWREVDQ